MQIGKMVFQAGRGTLVASLCVAMVADGQTVASQTVVLTLQQRTLHALNRLTFGPRPGDEAAVSKMGLEAWFQLQLHPERIEDAVFEAQLAKFPAMQLTQAELLQRFPGPQEIRQLAQGRGGADSGDAVQRAVVADAVYSYEVQRKKVETAAAAGGAAKMNADSSNPGLKSETWGTHGGGDSGMASGAAAVPTHDDEIVLDGPPKGRGVDGPPKGRGDSETMDVAAVLALGPEQRMARLVAMPPEEMAAFRGELKPFERVALMQGLTPAQMEIVAAMQGPARVVGAEVLESRLLRDVESKRQLQAVMTDFWLNHFSVYVRKNQNEVYYLPSYQNDVVLPNALGNFEQLLVATAESPAMLMYLDNWESIGPNSPAASRVRRVQQARPDGKLAQALPKGINENYARELMELHTLGVGGGYTQQDVIEVAKCFTGWTINRGYRGVGQAQTQIPFGNDKQNTDEFVFLPQRHEGGSKTVLGRVIPEGGMNEGLAVLHILATSPATAKFIATKLAVRFVSDTPPPALVEKMSATFLRSDGDIKAVLTTMFQAPEFWSPAVYRAKVKTPIEFLVSALRASDATVKNPLPLVQVMDRLGMPVYGMQTPNGYSWKADEWVSSNALVARMNFALVLSGGRLPGVNTDWPTLLATPASKSDSLGTPVRGDAGTAVTPSGATEKRLEMTVLGEAASVRTRETVLAQFNNPAAVKSAEESFNARKTAEEEDAANGAGMLQRTAYGRRGGQGFEPGPATPLDTMAGLLLGSPEFQRR